MKKVYYFSVLLIGAIIQVSCNQGNVEELQARIDSLQNVNEMTSQDYNDLSIFMETVSTSLDSIALSENMIIYSGNKEGGAKASREEIKNNLENFADLIQRQRAQIAELENRVSENSASRNKMKKIIQFMTEQLDAKEKEIIALRKELDNKNVDIANLNQKVTALNETNSELSNTIKAKEEEIVASVANQNQCYYIIASKKELQAKGIMSKGSLLKKAKVDVSGIDVSSFNKIDRRSTTKISINSKKAKVLSQMPEDSYTLSKDGDNMVLEITNAARFWSVTPLLIIRND